MRYLYPNKKLTTVFQPHLYSRTRDFAEGFSEVLSNCDELILLDIYPARELPIDGVSSEMIFKNIAMINKSMCTKKELVGVLSDRKIEVLLTVGAGDIDTLVEPLRQMLSK